MTVINKTNNITIASDITIANTLIAKNLGLIPYKKPKALLLKTRFGIHTFGMKYPIDVIILDKNKKVVTLKQSLQPNRIFLWNPLHDTVLELPQGSIAKSRTALSHILRL